MTYGCDRSVRGRRGTALDVATAAGSTGAASALRGWQAAVEEYTLSKSGTWCSHPLARGRNPQAHTRARVAAAMKRGGDATPAGVAESDDDDSDAEEISERGSDGGGGGKGGVLGGLVAMVLSCGRGR